MTIKTRQATSDDLGEILQLFEETIQTVNANDYSPEQITVWKNGALRRERWLKKIAEQYFLLAEIDSSLAGFGSITHDGYLDFLYVSRKHQRIGVAKTLYNQLEKFARENHVGRIISEVSITAKPFFQKQGFIFFHEQQVNIDGVKLTNYKMMKEVS